VLQTDFHAVTAFIPIINLHYTIVERKKLLLFFVEEKAFPLGEPPLGECPKDKGGAASGEETVTVR
jgi:hypothetical protein